jgi:hypothetical protein
LGLGLGVGLGGLREQFLLSGSVALAEQVEYEGQYGDVVGDVDVIDGIALLIQYTHILTHLELGPIGHYSPVIAHINPIYIPAIHSHPKHANPNSLKPITTKIHNTGNKTTLHPNSPSLKENTNNKEQIMHNKQY